MRPTGIIVSKKRRKPLDRLAQLEMSEYMEKAPEKPPRDELTEVLNSWYTTNKTWVWLTYKNEKLYIDRWYQALKIAIDTIDPNTDMRHIEFKQKIFAEQGIKYSYMGNGRSLNLVKKELGL